MSIKNAKQSVYSLFASNFNQMIGYHDEADRHARPKAAKILGVEYENVRVWSEGIYLPKGEVLLKIIEKYNVSLNWLLTGKEHIGGDFGSDWREDVKKACQDLASILMSNNEALKQAILANLAMFKHNLEQDQRIKDLERRLPKGKKGNRGPAKPSWYPPQTPREPQKDSLHNKEGVDNDE